MPQRFSRRYDALGQPFFVQDVAPQFIEDPFRMVHNPFSGSHTHLSRNSVLVPTNAHEDLDRFRYEHDLPIQPSFEMMQKAHNLVNMATVNRCVNLVDFNLSWDYGIAPGRQTYQEFNQGVEVWCSQQTAHVNMEFSLALKLMRTHLNITSALCEARIARLEQFALGLTDSDLANTAIPRAESELIAAMASLRTDWSTVSQRPSQLNTRVTAAYVELPDFVSWPSFYQKLN